MKALLTSSSNRFVFKDENILVKWGFFDSLKNAVHQPVVYGTMDVFLHFFRTTMNSTLLHLIFNLKKFQNYIVPLKMWLVL